MSSSPPRKPTVNFFTSAILLFGGSFGGTHLTAIVAPYSQFNGLVGFLMFPIAFMAGMQLWPWVCSGLDQIRSLLKRAKQSKSSAPQGAQRIISSFTFVLTSIAASGIAGLILTPPSMQVVVDPGYRILIPAGAVYGVLCWVLIQLGYLHHADV